MTNPPDFLAQLRAAVRAAMATCITSLSAPSASP